jgi:hypothetical protein
MILATAVPESKKAEHAGNLFGVRFLWIESFLFDNAGSLSEDYNGGSWDFFDLDNGGFYMAPSCGDHFSVACANGFDGELTADAFGITCCLCTLSQLSFSADSGFAQLCSVHYHRLREFMLQHAESKSILAAID